MSFIHPANIKKVFTCKVGILSEEAIFSSLLNRCQLLKERICPLEQIVPLIVELFID